MLNSWEVPKFIDYTGFKGLKEEFYDVCMIEATVISGFELTSQQECNTISRGEHSKVSRGRVYFDIPINDVEKVLSLRTVDNVNVVAYMSCSSVLPDTNEDILMFIKDLPKSFNWQNALNVWRRASQLEESVPVVFRVTCNRSGEDRGFSSMEAAKHFGAGIIELFGWKVSMTDYNLEVILNLNSDRLSVGLHLNKESLYKRNIVSFGPTVLRSTVCSNLLYMAQPQIGEIIVDTCCGSGAISIEGSIIFPTCYHVCGEISRKSIERSKENIDWLKSRKESPIGVELLQWNACFLPLKPSSVDVFITDLPFGKRLGSKEQNAKLYPKVVHQMAIASRPETSRAVILTNDQKSMIKALKKTGELWKSLRTLRINMGGLCGFVFLLRRTAKIV